MTERLPDSHSTGLRIGFSGWKVGVYKRDCLEGRGSLGTTAASAQSGDAARGTVGGLMGAPAADLIESGLANSAVRRFLRAYLATRTFLTQPPPLEVSTFKKPSCSLPRKISSSPLASVVTV